MLISMLPTAFASSGGGLKPGTGKMKFQLDYMQYTEAAKKAFEVDQAGDAEFSSIDDVGEDKAFYKKMVLLKSKTNLKSLLLKQATNSQSVLKWLTLITLLNQVMVLIICV